ncbi:MAG TPA: DUF2252 family protein [Mucilaginibacter sp.]|jgi:uncharacterized protein (DUF2252 family)|nr:DUF2252 family protein [Mucilaginibacter sp.]
MNTIAERIIAFNKGRLPEMLELKYKTMTESAFRFYRATCHLFYEDLAKVDNFPGSPLTWICGDLHLENFGSFKGDNRLVYFDLDDFDEAILAPCLWEISRMVTSMFVGFADLPIYQRETLAMAKRFINHYANTLATGKAVSIDPRTATGIVCSFLEKVGDRKQKELLKKRTLTQRGKIGLLAKYEKHKEVDITLKRELKEHIASWIKTSPLEKHGFKAIDCVFRIAGTGSLGVKRYVFLLKRGDRKGKYLLLDMKQAIPSSLQPYVNIKQPRWKNEADRVIQLKRRMQYMPPALLGTTLFKGDNYIVQEMQPEDDAIEFDAIKDCYKDVGRVIEDMAILAASAQLRATGRQGSSIADELIRFGQNNTWHDALLDYAEKYAQQVKRDYTQYLTDYESGKLG